MKPMRACTLALLLSLGITAKAGDGAPLKLVATIPLPGLKDGDFDHFAPDVDGHRLFLTAEENDKVQVLDTTTNQLIHTMDDVKAPHSMLFRKELKKLFVVEGDASAVKIYDSESFKPLGEVKVSVDADSLAYDPATSYLYVDIKIDSNHVEALVLEKSGPRLFMNITGKNAVGVMDRNKSTLTNTWPLPPGDKLNVAMAFDEANHRLFVVTRNPGKLVVLNSDNGKIIADIPAVAMVDDAAFDAQHKRVYAAGDQFVDVFQQKDPDHYSLLGRIPGSFRAKTGILVPELNRYYLAVPHHGDKEAEVRVYEIQP